MSHLLRVPPHSENRETPRHRPGDTARGLLVRLAGTRESCGDNVMRSALRPKVDVGSTSLPHHQCGVETHPTMAGRDAVLSDRERSALEEIERRIAADDPRLAVTLERWLPTPLRRTYNISIVLAAAATLLCVVLSAVGPALIAAMLTGVLLFQRVRGFAPRTPRRRA